MTIYAATGNLHKQKELQEILSPHLIRIPKDDGIDFDPEENGNDFVSNSLIKARTLYEVVHKPVIADDSGLCVDILGGRPGIFSARYAGKNALPADDGSKLPVEMRNQLLLEEAWEAAEEKAAVSGQKDISSLLGCHYVCCMVLYLGPDRFYSIQETMEGRLIAPDEQKRGTGGFGYDPVVFLPSLGKTVAELTDAEKNSLSHRGKAASKLKLFF
ncbi:MAG: non-canonical purine NTP pyrophosphatase [Treponema sp.]|nr:non-canonical purine NTP pyrophosphatase [Candidatus Treponema caballi]